MNAIRVTVARWEAGAYYVSGPRPDEQLGAIVELTLGTSARIGEVLAIRRRDIDLTGVRPTIRLACTIVSRKGEATFRQDHPKTRQVAAVQRFLERHAALLPGAFQHRSE